MNQTLILVSVFVAVLMAAFSVLNYFLRRAEISRNVGATRAKRTETDKEIDRMLGDENAEIRYYLDVVRNMPPNSLPMRLVQAGYFSKSAILNFNILRVLVSATVFTVIQIVTIRFVSGINLAFATVLAMLGAGISFILCSAVLERIGKKRSREFRKLFPDFMDLLIVCVDSGLGIEAAIERVTREFLVTTRDFGIQLSIVSLEIRAGRSIDEALQSFSKRINLEEARTLAVLFKQSQEIGASISKTLRVFAREMRQMRLIRAEEKANALPVKMLFPMALFMFPVNLIIVLVPIMMIILQMLLGLAPS
ncbi:type II secretion system F family protein [Marivita geojedonensis]|uniref:Type II secretion system protein GspF domain-containing protein n=1 Tax=Marivita geojedonensis TaxID=1123756 RepID=A0A1X4NC86_9RHOB|nr:type II secretion system F family protein [Marivita geojedonensis]OSQ44323.1 hypothetical protein MGEO_19090 [Marivita geojedonensis]PRY72910.1 tight adherence protein C [Marivita geojedonensis]